MIGHERRTKRPIARNNGASALAVSPAVRIPATASTLAGFREWAVSPEFPREGRISFIGGEIFIDMSPEELETHNRLKAEIGRVVGNVNVEDSRGLLYADRTLLTHVGADLSTEPDGLFVAWESLESGRIRQVPRRDDPDEYMELEGSADWVLEIVSKYSVQKDTQDLRRKYHRAGVCEYWLIDARGEEIDFQILIRGKRGFQKAASRGGWQRSVVFERYFRLERRRHPLGPWIYTLRVKRI
jgi:Uma2 family endonuclease